MDPDAGELHLAVCRRFGEAVGSAHGKWNRRSPCDEWDARGVLEHVIGFHDVLLLRPLGLKPNRPQNPQARWQLTYDALTEVFNPGRAIFERLIDVPKIAKSPATRLDARKLVPSLTRDVLVHTWDLARAVGADDRLDPGWCELFYSGLPEDPQALSASGMFNAPVAVNSETDVQARLLARLGRDPSWRPDHS